MKPVACTLSELAEAYRINSKTLKKWIARYPEIQLIPNQKILTPLQVKMIFEKIGEP